MTPNEFKIKYPHLSHLGDNDLWDALEDAYIHEHKDDKPQGPTDWKGNVIKEGDEVCYIKIRTGSFFSNLGLLIPDEAGGYTEYKMGEEPEEDCWEVGEYIKIGKGLRYTSTIGEYTFNMLLTEPAFCIQPGTILAIKGVSDMKE